MKRFLILISILSATSARAFTVSSCNYPTKNKYEGGGEGRVSSSTTTTNVPDGPCDRLGALSEEVGVKDCAEVATKKGYNCFQVEDMEINGKVFSSWGVDTLRSGIIKSCYACLAK